MVGMMCPGISYSTVHSLIFHNNGSVQENKLFQEFCNRKQAHFIDIKTLTLKDQPEEEKYDDSNSPITMEYEVITTFMKIHNISATWENYWNLQWPDWPHYSGYQLQVGSYWCLEGSSVSCCSPM